MRAPDGWPGTPADVVWRSTLEAPRTSLARLCEATTVVVAGDPASVVLWDRDTLGSPGPALAGDPATLLGRLAREEPHTWALVESDRYAVGDLASYLVARMTRGLEHLSAAASDPTGPWSPPRLLAAGVPADALPEPEPAGTVVATTDPTTFLGVALPVVLAAS